MKHKTNINWNVLQVIAALLNVRLKKILERFKKTFSVCQTQSYKLVAWDFEYVFFQLCYLMTSIVKTV